MENQESPLNLLNRKFNLILSLIRAMVKALRKRNTSWSWVELDQANNVQEYDATVCTQYVHNYRICTHRVAQLVAAWQPGCEKMERERENEERMR